jgi:hypothetical protein
MIQKLREEDRQTLYSFKNDIYNFEIRIYYQNLTLAPSER